MSNAPKDKDKIKVVANLLKCRAGAVSKHQRNSRGGKIADRSSLGTSGGAESLSNVHALLGCPAQREYDTKQEDEGDGGIGGIGVTRVIDGHLGCTGDNCESDGAEENAVDEQGSSANSVGETGANNTAEKAENAVDCV